MNASRILNIIFILIIQSAGICQENIPEWITNRSHSAYPPDRYIIGIGIAQETGNVVKDRKNADNNALAEISQQIITSVKSISQNQSLEIIKSGVAESTEETKINVDVSSESKLMGAKIAEQYYNEDEKIYYSLAVFDKYISLEYLKNKLTGKRNSFDDAIDKINKYLNEGTFPNFLSEIKSAILLAGDFNSSVFLYNVLASQNSYKDSLDASELPEQKVLTILNNCLANIYTYKISGDSQKVVLAKAADNPLVLKIICRMARDVPLNGVPVVFNFISGKGEITSDQRTNAEGLVSATINKTGASENKRYLVEARINLTNFLDTTSTFANFNRIISNYQKTEQFSLEQQEFFNNTKALVLIDFTREHNKLNSEALFSSISKILIEHGITAVNMSEFSAGDNSKSDKYNKDKLKALFGTLKLNQSEFSFIIECNLTANFINELYGYKSYTVSGNMRAFSLLKNKSIAEETVKDIKGAASSPDLAALAALKKIPDSLIQKFVESIINGVYN